MPTCIISTASPFLTKSRSYYSSLNWGIFDADIYFCCYSYKFLSVGGRFETQVQGSKFQVSGVKVLCTKYQVPSIRCQMSGSRFQASGTWCQVSGSTWQVPGVTFPRFR